MEEVKYLQKPKLKAAIAIAGSPGLRSVGAIAIDHLVGEWTLKPFAEFYSSSFPVLYHGVPYAGAPGEAGSIVMEGILDAPKVEFYQSKNLVITKGYQAEMLGQYAVAQRVVEVYKELGVKRIITLGGYVPSAILGEKRKRRVSFCATNARLIREMEGLGLGKEYVGPFLGFSGLVLGIGMEKGIEGIGLFGETTPDLEHPTRPDPAAAEVLLEKLGLILGIEIDTSSLVEEIKEEVEGEIAGYI